jgi:hypothetical protein
MFSQDQSFFRGPIAQTLPDGCDLGMWLAFIFAVSVYPLLRTIELRFLGR